jgi:hypothetical protein
MAAGDPLLLRLLAADELGYVRCAQAAGPDAASLAAAQVVARWGDGVRTRGVERLALADGDGDADAQGLLAGARADARLQRPAAAAGCGRRHPLRARAALPARTAPQQLRLCA